MTEEAPRMSKSAITRQNNFTRILQFLMENPGEHTSDEICRAVNLKNNMQVGSYCARMDNVARSRNDLDAGGVTYKYVRWVHWVDVTLASKKEHIDALKARAKAEGVTVDEYVKRAVNVFSGGELFPEVNDGKE